MFPTTFEIFKFENRPPPVGVKTKMDFHVGLGFLGKGKSINIINLNIYLWELFREIKAALFRRLVIARAIKFNPLDWSRRFFVMKGDVFIVLNVRILPPTF